MPTDWQFTSIITITVTYQRKSDGWKSNRYLRYFHLVGLAEAKENPYVWLDRTRRCSIWCVSVSFCGFFFSFFFFEFRKSSQGALEKISRNSNLLTRSLLVLLYFFVWLFLFSFSSNASMCTHIRGVSYLLPSETDDIDRKITQSSNGRPGAKFKHVVLLSGYIQ